MGMNRIDYAFRPISWNQYVSEIDEMRCNVNELILISCVNGISINGAGLSKMLTNKMYAISGENVCRRMKDVLDIMQVLLSQK